MSRHEQTPETELAHRARKRVGMKTAFFIHLLVYALVNTALVLAHLAGVSQRWHPGPLLGWGVGLAIHGIVTFINLHSDGLRERMVANEVERLKARQ